MNISAGLDPATHTIAAKQAVPRQRGIQTRPPPIEPLRIFGVGGRVKPGHDVLLERAVVL